MIVVDTSALIAILDEESGADRLGHQLMAEDERLISAATYVEAAMVMARKRLDAPWDAVSDLDAYLREANVKIIDLDRAQARVAMEGRLLYGQGFGTGGGLNFGDSFAYALAKVRNAPLLFVGEDFGKTDIQPALV